MALFLYLSLLKEEKIVCYQIDSITGNLALQYELPVSGEPSILATDAERRTLYAAIRSTGQLCSFRIDSASGRLEHLHSIDTGLEDPAYLSTDREGRYLITPYYASGKVSVYRIGADGAAREPLVSAIDTAPHAHGLAIDPSNRFIFVPHTCPGNAIWQLVLADGVLRPNSPPKVEFDHDVGPRHLHLHPHNGCAYGDNEQDQSVTAYRFDPDTGTLAPFQTLSTLPEDHTDGACARMEIHPSGRFLYAANRGHDSLAGFRIDGESGTLESIGHFPTASNPRSFHFDPEGRFLYAAGQSSDQLVSYRIDGKNGTLEPLQTYSTGHVPWWVQVVKSG